MQMKVELAKRCDERDDEDRMRCFKREEWQRAMVMLEHSNPIVWAEGEALVKELHAQRGTETYLIIIPLFFKHAPSSPHSLNPSTHSFVF